MKVKSLTLHGFKSFADRTRIDIHAGITAIVGPNGCGKSNVADAIRWVLGEQRPTAIRGSRMEEAIFGGTEQRRPIQRAEVSLALSNEEGVLPVPYSEVVMGRTVYRGGEGEYSLNGVSCRLRDVQDLCRDTGLGANAYAIIEGRMIDAILSDRAEERRALFEEAAEVGRYKSRRRTALRRLEQAEADLQRLDDLIGEVEKKVRSLAQQRGRAKRFAELRRRRLQLDVAVADTQLARAREQAAETQKELAALQSIQAGEETALQTAETEAESLRLHLLEAERGRSGAARQLEETRQRLEERERERLIARERIAAAERRAVTLDEELARLGTRRDEIEEEVREAQEKLQESEEIAAGVAEEVAKLRGELDDLRSVREDAIAAEETARRRLAEVWRDMEVLEAEGRATAERLMERAQELERRNATLQKLEAVETELRAKFEQAEVEAGQAREAEARFSGEASTARSTLEEERDAVRKLRDRVGVLEGERSADQTRYASLSALLSSGADLPGAVADLKEASLPGVQGILADAIHGPAEIAPAVEVHLGPYLHAVVVDDWRTVQRVQKWLDDRAGEDGLILLPLDPGPRISQGRDAASTARLSDVVKVRGPGAAWARALLGTARYEPDRELTPASSSWIRADGMGQDLWGGVLLGQPGPGKGVLARRNELTRLEARATKTESKLQRARAELAERESQLARLEGEADELERHWREASRAREEAEARRAGLAERLERLGIEREETRSRIHEIEASLRTAQDRSESSGETLARLQDQRESAREAFAESKSILEAAEANWETARGALHALELDMTRGEATVTAAREGLGRCDRALKDLEERADRLRADRAQQDEIIASSHATVERSEADVVHLLEQRRSLEDSLREIENRLEEQRSDLEERESVLRGARKEEREHAERRHQLELLDTELRARQAGVEERLQAEWDAPLNELRALVEPPEEGTPADWEAALEGVRLRLNRLGPVNLLAEEEYETEKKRLEFLEDQRKDLVGARDDLRNSIRRINEKASEAFLETFDQVRANFQRTFQTLFEGGQCDVWLEDTTNPLDSPIEISASPRGKRTQRIHLLSGGERALTALALLFAIYLVKPSPFCLMDEVDAPLDESNVGRFVAMLERFKADTQFIVITHNPQTIAAADWIYGVTMQEPGVSSVVGVRFAEPSGQVA